MNKNSNTGEAFNLFSYRADTPALHRDAAQLKALNEKAQEFLQQHPDETPETVILSVAKNIMDNILCDATYGEDWENKHIIFPSAIHEMIPWLQTDTQEMICVSKSLIDMMWKHGNRAAERSSGLFKNGQSLMSENSLITLPALALDYLSYIVYKIGAEYDRFEMAKATLDELIDSIPVEKVDLIGRQILFASPEGIALDYSDPLKRIAPDKCSQSFMRARRVFQAYQKLLGEWEDHVSEINDDSYFFGDDEQYNHAQKEVEIIEALSAIGFIPLLYPQTPLARDAFVLLSSHLESLKPHSQLQICCNLTKYMAEGSDFKNYMAQNIELFAVSHAVKLMLYSEGNPVIFMDVISQLELEHDNITHCLTDNDKNKAMLANAENEKTDMVKYFLGRCQPESENAIDLKNFEQDFCVTKQGARKIDNAIRNLMHPTIS